jgi:hypothetical protein
MEVLMGLRGKGARPLSVHSSGRLSDGQYNWLMYGFAEKWADAFTCEEEYRDAWMWHREELLQDKAPGRKPLAWWHVESGHDYPGYDEERRYLYAHDLLGVEEREALLADWRRAFERGWKWSDVPPELWTEWENEKAAALSVAEPTPAA